MDEDMKFYFKVFALLIALTGASGFGGYEIGKGSVQPVEVQNDGFQLYGIWSTNLSKITDGGYNGTFICVNINAADTLEKVEETCEHESGHEVWARQCANNFTRCLDFEKKMEDATLGKTAANFTN